MEVTPSDSSASSDLSPAAQFAEAPLPRHAIGAWQASLTLFKAIVGPGVLFLPSGVKNAGLLPAAGVSAIVGVLSAWCMLLVLDSAAHLRRCGVQVADFGDIGAATFGSLGRFAVSSAIVTSQLGFCTAYCVFVAENLQAVIFEANGGLVGRAGEGAECGLVGLLGDERLVYYIIAVIFPLLIPVTWVRQIRFFWATSLLASLLVVGSLVFLMIGFGVRLADGTAPPTSQLHWFDPAGALVYFGTAAYAFEGIGMLLPIQRAMHQPSRLPRVVCWTMGGACMLQVVFASAAYGLYGDETASIITVSLDRGSFLLGSAAVQAVQLAWILEVLFTFPLQLFPAAVILERLCLPERRSGRKWTKNLIRTGLVLLCMLVATGGYTSVDNLVALIGALGCVPLAMVYPALFHWKARQMKPPGGQEWVLMSGDFVASEAEALWGAAGAGPGIGGPRSDACIASVGVAGVVLATVLAVRSWVTESFEFQVCIARTSLGVPQR